MESAKLVLIKLLYLNEYLILKIFIAQRSFIPRFLVDKTRFCDKIRRPHTVLGRSRMKEAQNFLKEKV